jgi:hypothetical protein
LAHNERHPVTGSPVAKVIHNFGRKDKVDKEALARLVSSISRILDLPMTEVSGLLSVQLTPVFIDQAATPSSLAAKASSNSTGVSLPSPR